MVRLPITPRGPFFSVTTELDEVSYVFTFRWNGRGGWWLVDIASSGGVVLVRGLRLTVNVPLLRGFRSPLLPSGLLMAADSTGRGEDPTFESLGRNTLVYYVPPEELASLPAPEA